MVTHAFAGGVSVSSSASGTACQPSKRPFPSSLSTQKWRKGIIAAAGPGPQPVTRPAMPPPSRPSPPPFPGQAPPRGSNGANGNGGNGNGAGSVTLSSPPRPAGPVTAPPRPPGSLPMSPPPGMTKPSAPPPMNAPPPMRTSAPPAGAPMMGQPSRPGPLPGPPGPRPPAGPGTMSAQPSAPVQLSKPGAPPSPSLSRPPPTAAQQPAPSQLPRPTAAPPPPAQQAAAVVTTPQQPATAQAPAGPKTLTLQPPIAPTPAAQSSVSSMPIANPFANIPRTGMAATAPPPPPSAGPTPPLVRPAAPAPPAQPAGAQPPALLNRPAPPPLQRPAASGLAAPPPRPQGPLQRPGGPAGAAPALMTPPSLPSSPPPLQQPLRPPGRSDLLARTPPSAPPTTLAADAVGVSNLELVKPNPPTLRVLEPLMAEAAAAAAAAAANRLKMEIQEVVEDEDDELFDDEDGEFVNRGSALKAKGKKGGRRKEKVTAEMKREARRQREAARQEKEASRRRDKEEIFEVGEEGMSLDALAELLQVNESDIVRSLFMRGITLSMSQMLDRNTVKLVASDYDVVVVDSASPAVTDAAKKRTEFINEEDVDDLAVRPPVVTVMGHVDHGKTSLLDYIRKARVAAGEAGGITQAIGAYNTEVEVDGDHKTICFLDTPGHEAFSAMRARGAQVTDIAVIIVAADDGVRPQTREAVAHAQAAGVPIVVAINKVDKPGADVDRVKQELLELNLVPEEWGGNTVMVPVSAKKGTGVPDLLTQLLWVAEEKQLMSNPKRPARGTVIEAYLDKKKGAVATLLVQVGTLRPGDIVRAGASYGKVRALTNDLGRTMPSAGPSIAVQLTGLNSVPAAGEEFEVCPTEQAARLAAAEFEERIKMRRIMEMSGGGSLVTLASLATVDEDQEALQRLNIIIKADTSGMVEAIKSALSMLPQQSVMLRFLLAGAGDITASDIDLAAASGGMVLAFNLEPDEAVQSQAKGLGVSVKSYRIIYELIEDVKAAMEGKLKLVEEKVPQGTAVVKALFGSGKKRVAGVAVTEGKLTKAGYVTVKRGKTVVYDGKLSSLRRVKDLVEEVSAGLECGVGCEGFTDWSEGDSIECYLLVTKSRRLEDARATMVAEAANIE